MPPLPPTSDTARVTWIAPLAASHASSVDRGTAGAAPDPGRGGDWRAQMLAQTEAMTHSGSAEIDLVLGQAVLSEGLLRLLERPDLSAHTPVRRLLRSIPREERPLVLSIWRSALEGEPFEFRHRLLRGDGTRREVLHLGLIPAGNMRHGYLSMQDITQRHQDTMRIQELVGTDSVTGLPNRQRLLEHIETACDSQGWDERAVAVLSVKVEQIDHLQDAMGHRTADDLARAVAVRLSATHPELAASRAGADPDQLIARVDSTEFALVLRAPAAEIESQAQTQARRLMHALSQPERLGLIELVPGGCVGIATFPGHDLKPGEVLEAAQMARQDAQGANEHISHYSHGTRSASQRRLALEAGLRHAIERGELRVGYRLQAELRSGALTGAEALLQWHSASLGQVPAAEFIPVAERSGQIVALGDWARRRVCEVLRQRKRAGLKPLRLALNISPIELGLPDIVQRIQALLVEHEAEPAWLALEVPERALTHNPEDAVRKLNALRATGVEIVLDNFGIGESNIGLLRNMPFQLVKVHPSFAPDIGDPPEKALLLRAIIHLAHSMQTHILVQGADNEGRVSLLQANGGDRVQGLVLGQDLDEQAMVELDALTSGLPQHLIRPVDHKQTLLLVDDDPSILASLKRLFRPDGYRILTADSGAQGLQRMAESAVDVVLSDQRMPGMTGVEFLRRAKALYPHTVRLVLSGYTELQSITDAVNEGAIYRFLTKPWDDELLRQHVQEAFEHKGLSDENERLSEEVQAANRELACVNRRLAGVLDEQQKRIGLETLRAGATRHMMDRLPVAVLGVDDEGNVVMVNTDGHTLLGNRQPLLGAPVREVLGLSEPTPIDGAQIVLAGHHWQVKERQLQHPGLQGRLLILEDRGQQP